MAAPTSKVDIDPNFEAQLQSLVAQSNDQQVALSQGGQVRWTRPENWNGDPFDYNNISVALNRDAANAGFVAATSDPSTPGVSGDLISATTMIDYMATMERSFRNRITMNRCRRMAHLGGVKLGQGSESGVFITAPLEYVRRVVAKARGQS